MKNNDLADSTPLRKRAWSINTAIFALFFMCSFSAFSQSLSNPNIVKTPDTKRLYLKVNPMSVLFGPIPLTSEYGLRFEMVVNHRFTYQLGAGYLNKTLILQSALVEDTVQSIWDDFHFPGVRVQGEVRYYFVKARSGKNLNDYLSPSGLYIALHASYATATFKAKTVTLPKEEWTNLTVSVLVGAQLIQKESVGIDAYFGLGYKNNTATFTDYRSRTRNTDISDVYQDGLGAYLTSPIKVNLGCNFTFGLL